MNFSVPTGPAGHLGISLALALVLRLNPFVTVFCGILPDLVDKSLAAALNIGGGRYVAHTLLFVILVSGAFFLWNKRYGLAALVGGVSHLLLDSQGFMPWFYPFKDYDFPDSEFSFTEYIQYYFTASVLGMELLIIAAVGIATLLFLLFYRWHNKKAAEQNEPLIDQSKRD